VRAAIGFYDESGLDPRKDIIGDHLIEPRFNTLMLSQVLAEKA
jgi:hypothetical protein